MAQPSVESDINVLKEHVCKRWNNLVSKYGRFPQIDIECFNLIIMDNKDHDPSKETLNTALNASDITFVKYVAFALGASSDTVNDYYEWSELNKLSTTSNNTYNTDMLPTTIGSFSITNKEVFEEEQKGDDGLDSTFEFVPCNTVVSNSENEIVKQFVCMWNLQGIPSITPHEVNSIPIELVKKWLKELEKKK